MKEQGRVYKFGRKVGHGLKKLKPVWNGLKKSGNLVGNGFKKLAGFPYKAEVASIPLGWGLGEAFLTDKISRSLGEGAGVLDRVMRCTPRVDIWSPEIYNPLTEKISWSMTGASNDISVERLYNIPAEIDNLLGKRLSYGVYKIIKQLKCPVYEGSFLTGYKLGYKLLVNRPECFELEIGKVLVGDYEMTRTLLYETVKSYNLSPQEHWLTCLLGVGAVLGTVSALKYGPNFVRGVRDGIRNHISSRKAGQNIPK